MSDIFAEIEPSLYDLSLAKVVPHLSMHRHARAVAFEGLLRFAGVALVGADLGVGTGADLLDLVEPLQEGVVYAFDNSENMVSGLRRRLEARALSGPDIRYMQCNLGEATHDTIDQVVREIPRGLDFVTSAFVIHNLPVHLQLRAFKVARRLLRDGGWFFYLDLFRFEDGMLSSVAAGYDERFIIDSFEAAPQGVDLQEWRRLRDRWLEHYRSENNLVPWESVVGISAASALREVGFRSMEVVSRCFQAALVVCRA